MSDSHRLAASEKGSIGPIGNITDYHTFTGEYNLYWVLSPREIRTIPVLALTEDISQNIDGDFSIVDSLIFSERCHIVVKGIVGVKKCLIFMLLVFNNELGDGP